MKLALLAALLRCRGGGRRCAINFGDPPVAAPAHHRLVVAGVELSRVEGSEILHREIRHWPRAGGTVEPLH